MNLSTHLRSKLTVLGIAGAMLSAAATVTPVAAQGTTINFTASTNNDVTTMVTCPTGTPANIVLCGYAINTPLTASNTSGDQGLSGSIKESFVSDLAAPAPTTGPNPPACAAAMADQSAITLQTSKGNILLVTSGSFCTVTGLDVEPFVVVGGTGEYQGATGSGVVNAQQISATAAAETYTGTIVLAR